MTQVGPLSWVSGEGWLVLVSDVADSGDIDATILARINPIFPIAYLPTGDGSFERGEAILDDYADLGGPRGDIVPVLDMASANDPQNGSLLADAGLIYVGDGNARTIVRALNGSLALEGIGAAFARGAMIVGVGAGAQALGAWILPEGGVAGEPGLGWLHNAIIAQPFTGAGETPALQEVLREQPGLVGVGLAPETALALGPQGEVETWGQGEVTVVVAR